VPGQLRQGQHEPIVPAQNGQAPGWIVRCVETGCGFAVDAHGRTAEAAVASIAPTHAADHVLTAEAARYHEPIWGPNGNQLHPLYYP